MTLRELQELLAYPELLTEEIEENQFEAREMLDFPVVLNDGIREFEITSIYVHGQDKTIYVDVEELNDVDL